MGIWSDYKTNYTSCFPKGFFRTLSDKAANITEQGSMKNWTSFGWRSLVAAPICAVSSTFGSLYAGARFGASVTYNAGGAIKPLSYLTLGTLPLAIGITSGILATAGGLAAGAISTVGFATAAAISAVPVTTIGLVKSPFFIAGMFSGSSDKVQQQPNAADVPQAINANRAGLNSRVVRNDREEGENKKFANEHKPKGKDHRVKSGETVFGRGH